MNDEELLNLIASMCEQTIRDSHSFPPGDHMNGRKTMASQILRTIRDHKEKR